MDQGLDSRLKNPQYNAAQAKQHIDNRMKILKALHDGGVGVLLGSDAPQQFNVPGFSIHREMRRMADAGISNYEIVKSGTANVGQHFKAQDAFGTIAVGQRADLILVDANSAEPGQHGEAIGRHGAWTLAASVGDRRPARKDRSHQMRRFMDAYPLARRDILTLAGLASISPFAVDVAEPQNRAAAQSDARRRELYALLGELPARSRPISGKASEAERDGYLLETWDLDLNGIENVPRTSRDRKARAPGCRPCSSTTPTAAVTRSASWSSSTDEATCSRCRTPRS